MSTDQHTNQAQPETAHRSTSERLAAAAQATADWTQDRLWPWLRDAAGPWLARRGKDFERAMDHGWTQTAAWLKAVVMAIAAAGLITSAVLLLRLALGFWHHTMLGSHHDGIAATVTRPVHTYLTTHGHALPISTVTVYALWQLAAPILFVMAAYYSTIARLAWIGYGAATAAMVWSATPDSGRSVATAITAAGWTVLSLIALRGLSFTPLLLVQPAPHAVPNRASTDTD